MRMSWNDIAEKYPNQWVVLSDVIWEEKVPPYGNIESACVYKAGLTIQESLQIALENNMLSRRTTFTNGDY